MVNSGREQIAAEKTPKEKTFSELTNKYAEAFREKDNEKLYEILKSTKTNKLASKNYITALKKAYPNCKAELEAFYEELQEKIENKSSPYHKFTNEDGAFKPAKLGNQMKKDYHFVCLKDSGQLLVYKNGWWQANAKELIEEEVNKRLGEEYSKRRKEGVISHIKTSSYVDRENFQPPKRKINFKNGVYDLEEKELKPHNPAYAFTFQIPWKYKEDKEAEEISKFLKEVTYSEEDAVKLKELSAYTLIPSYPFNKAGMLAGNGNNGKTIFIQLLKEMIGQKNYTDKKLQDLKDGFDTHFLYGKLACFDDDLPPTKLTNTDIFKKLTGGSDIGAEVKFGDQYNFNPFSKFIFAANKIPPTTDKSAGFFRRWIIVDFPYTFKENPPEHGLYKQSEDRDKLLARLTSEEEMEGFLSECVRRLEKMLDQNGFTYSEDVDSTRQKWRRHSTPITSFIERFVKQGESRSENSRKKENEDNPDWENWTFDYIRKDDLHKMVSAWCKKHGEGPPSKKKLTQSLQDSDYWVGNTQTNREPNESRVRVYSGIKIELDKKDDRIPSFLYDLPMDDSNQSIFVVSGKQGLSLENRVKDFMKENYSSDSVILDDLRSELDDEGLLEDGEDLESVVNDLLNDGVLFEPDPGRLQYLS